MTIAVLADVTPWAVLDDETVALRRTVFDVEQAIADIGDAMAVFRR